MVLDILTQIFNMLWQIIKGPIFLFGFFLGYLVVTVCLHIFKAYKKGFRFRKGSRQKVEERKWYQKLFVDFPKRLAQDLMERDPDFFDYQGLIIFEGTQGAGKSMAMTEFISRMLHEYPLAKCITNYGYIYENVKLKHWKQLISYKNDKLGVVVGIDEMQNWFSSKQSKDFPPEMLGVVTQNRKNRRVICGTAQNFYMLSKDIRTQTVEVRKCLTLFKCLTIVRRKAPVFDSQGEVIEWKNRGSYWFVQSDELRNSYDTYKVIENLSEAGFQPKAPESVVVNNNFVASAKC